MSKSLYPARLLCPRDSSGKNTGVGCQALLQEIFLTKGSNTHLLCLLNWQADSLPLVLPGKRMQDEELAFYSKNSRFYMCPDSHFVTSQMQQGVAFSLQQKQSDQ